MGAPQKVHMLCCSQGVHVCVAGAELNGGSVQGFDLEIAIPYCLKNTHIWALFDALARCMGALQVPNGGRVQNVWQQTKAATAVQDGLHLDATHPG